MFVSRWFKLISLGCGICLRLNASNWLVSAAARFDAFRICSSGTRFGSSGARAVEQVFESSRQSP